jgi:hypothetical protein
MFRELAGERNREAVVSPTSRKARRGATDSHPGHSKNPAPQDFLILVAFWLKLFVEEFQVFGGDGFRVVFFGFFDDCRAHG